MTLSHTIAVLTRQLEEHGDRSLGPISLIAAVYGDDHRIAIEHRNRQQLIVEIIRAKRAAGFPPDSVFFRDVWPPALEALLESRKPEGSS